MLILSRRINEKILFPGVSASIEVLGFKGNQVRLGIEAPPDLQILREELAGLQESKSQTLSHEMRNRLNQITLALHLYDKQRHAGQEEVAESTLQRLFVMLDGLERDCLPRQAAPAKTPPKTRKPRFLIVDDDRNERELLAGLLNMNGCECQTAADGQEALDVLAHNDRLDLLLLDMWMPRLNGPQTVTQIRNDPRYKGLKIFAISGAQPDELGVSTGPSGVDAWFCKPLNPRTLWDAIQKNVRSQN